MHTTFVSTAALARTLRTTLIKNEGALADGQTEVQTGRLADVGASLGARTGDSLALRLELTELTTIGETNGIVKTQLEASQGALGSIVKTAQNFVSVMVGARSSATGPGAALGTAKAAVQSLSDQLNASVGGVYVFSGENTGVMPFKGDLDPVAGAAGMAISNAFATAFGMAPGAAGSELITSSAMTTFIDGAFANEFADPAWAANWSDASSQNLSNRISPDETIVTSVNANDPAFRKLAKAYSMIASLGVSNMAQGTFEAVADKAISIAQQALGEVANLQSELGISQQRVSDANDRASLRSNILQKAVDGMEGVNAYDAAIRVSQLQTQLETSFSLTSRIQKLSLLNYL